MSCDMVGSTALSDRLDPEEYREVITSFQNYCSAEIMRLGGTVARYLGDGLLAYFGHPTAREDDAERAICAGLAIVDGVATRRLKANIGIASGIVLVDENGVIGETPNLAA